MRSSSFALESEDGLEVFVYRWLPEDESVRAVVQIAHGMGEHAERYERVAERLVGEGYAVYANDHRGHGRTAVPPDAGRAAAENLGHLADEDGWNRAVRDLYLLNRRIAKEHPRAARVLLGHSMGSLMAQQYLTEHGDSIGAAVLSGSTGNPGSLRRIAVWIARIERLRLGRRGQSSLLRSLLFGRSNREFEPSRTEFDWLSRDRHEVARYAEDPLCGFVLTAQSLLDMFAALGRMYAADALESIQKELPVLIFSGEEDPIHEHGRGLERLVAGYEAAGLRNVSKRVYARGRHEMFNETNRDEVVADLLAWLEKNLVLDPG